MLPSVWLGNLSLLPDSGLGLCLLPQHDTQQGLNPSCCLPSLSLLLSQESAKEWLPAGLVIPILLMGELRFNPGK